MIRQLWIVETEETFPYRNLALEEYLLMHVPADTCILFLWQNKHTIVIGRNQNPAKECSLKHVREDKVNLVRRLSGGGAVYHDMGNMNFTFLVGRDDYDVDRQLSVIVTALAQLGIAAEKTGRNDVQVDGRKISGNAFYKKEGACYHHGTLLIDTDKELIGRYLTVAPEKLAMKGVDSVRSRVGNLKDFKPDITIDEVKAALADAYGKVYGLQPVQKAVSEFPAEAVEEGAVRFASEEWIYGKSRFYGNQVFRRYAWGQAEILWDVKDGVISDVCIYSDAMEQDYILRIEEALRGCRLDESDIGAALADAAEAEISAGTLTEPEAARQVAEDINTMICDIE